MNGRDGVGLAVVGGGVASMLAFRAVYVEPAGACWGVICWARTGLLWLQAGYLWGTIALGLGLAAFFGRWWRVGVAAVLVGAAAVINYNVTWGMVGAALGAWVWIMRDVTVEASGHN